MRKCLPKVLTPEERYRRNLRWRERYATDLEFKSKHGSKRGTWSKEYKAEVNRRRRLAWRLLYSIPEFRKNANLKRRKYRAAWPSKFEKTRLRNRKKMRDRYANDPDFRAKESLRRVGVKGYNKHRIRQLSPWETALTLQRLAHGLNLEFKQKGEHHE
jgi:hypothetical protein